MATIPRQIVSANDLLDGHVVYLTAGDGWSQALSDAAIAENAADATALLAIADAQQAQIVGPYLIGIGPSSGAPEPALLREKLRVTGLSIRPDPSVQ